MYHCNRAACYVKLGQWDAVVDDCTSALEAQPRYVKALSRRMQAFEALDKPTEALGDARLLAEIESTAAARATVSRLEKVEAEKLEREKEEMMGAPRSRPWSASAPFRARALARARAALRRSFSAVLRCANGPARPPAHVRRQAQRPGQHVLRELWPLCQQL